MPPIRSAKSGATPLRNPVLAGVPRKKSCKKEEQEDHQEGKDDVSGWVRPAHSRSTGFRQARVPHIANMACHLLEGSELNAVNHPKERRCALNEVGEGHKKLHPVQGNGHQE